MNESIILYEYIYICIKIYKESLLINTYQKTYLMS